MVIDSQLIWILSRKNSNTENTNLLKADRAGLIASRRVEICERCCG